MRRRLAVLFPLLFIAFIVWSTQADTVKRVGLGTVYANSVTIPTVPAPFNTQLRVLSWNIAFGKGTDGIENYDRTATWITALSPDLIGLCEIPPDRVSTLITLLTQKTGHAWFSHFAPKFPGSQEGNLIISRFPILSVNSLFLSASRSVASANVDVGGRTVNFFATHLDDQSSTNRVAEVTQLTQWAAGFPEPRIVTGDFNGGPDTAESLTMAQTYFDSWAESMNVGTAISYPDNPVWLHTRTRRGRIDYVFYSRQSSGLLLRGSLIPDTRDLTNTNVVVTLGTLDDRGVRPSDHNPTLATFELSGADATPTPTPTPTATPTPTPTQLAFLQFSGASINVGEGSSADITVTRTGNTSISSTVHYATADGSALRSGDYITATGMLTFSPGQTTQSFRLLMVDDVYMEGSEVLSLMLTDPSSGSSVGNPSTAAITIVDNDFANPTANPIDNAEFFVRQQYLDFLNRQPDVNGLNFWVNEITSCGSNASCVVLKRINVSAAFFLSIEFQETGVLACLTNKAAFGTFPVYQQFEFDRQNLQRSFVFGADGWAARLEANKQAYFAELVQRAEFAVRYQGMSNNQYVDSLIQNAGVTFTTTERSALVNGLNGGTETRATVLRKVAEKPGFKQAELTRIFVLMEYFGYLKRDPDGAGFNFWLNKLNSFGGNFVDAEMVKAFLVSIEYRIRFSNL